MKSRAKSKISKSRLKKLLPVFGPPPVLRSESHVQYKAIVDRYFELFDPQDVLELTLLTYLVNDVWLIKRYTRHQTLGIDAGTSKASGFRRSVPNRKMLERNPRQGEGLKR